MIKLRLTQDRRLIGIESDDITVRINGKTNRDYQQMLAPAGIELIFEPTPPEALKPPEGSVFLANYGESDEQQ